MFDSKSDIFTVQFTVENAFLVFLPLFWAYFGQPDKHIDWATLMSFSSIYRTNARTNLRNFREKNWELGELKMSFFLSRPFWILLQIFFFDSSTWKSVKM